MRNHTPTPWIDETTLGSAIGAAPIIVGVSNGCKRPVLKAMYWPGSEDPEVLGNRDFALLACNSHDDLVSWLQYVVDKLDDLPVTDNGITNTAVNDVFKNISAVLQKIEKEKKS
jgi:hypothetical protein